MAGKAAEKVRRVPEPLYVLLLLIWPKHQEPIGPFQTSGEDMLTGDTGMSLTCVRKNVGPLCGPTFFVFRRLTHVPGFAGISQTSIAFRISPGWQRSSWQSFRMVSNGTS